MSVPISQFIPPPFSPLGVHTSVFYVCLSFCFAYRFICTIFLDPTYMCKNHQRILKKKKLSRDKGFFEKKYLHDLKIDAMTEVITSCC